MIVPSYLTYMLETEQASASIGKKMNNATARTNMISQQLRTNGIVNEALIDLYEQIPRENFVPQAYQAFAYSDLQIPLIHQQTMMTPLEEASILQALNLQGVETVLEVGTGSGYFTALLASCAKHVVSVDIYEDFTLAAKDKLDHHGINNVTLITGNAERGWMNLAPYDVIVLTGSIPELDQCFRPQLLKGGSLFAVTGRAPAMMGMFYRLDQEDQWHKQVLFETNISPLIPRKLNTSFEL